MDSNAYSENHQLKIELYPHPFSHYMEDRQRHWRARLMGTSNDIERKRKLYYKYIQGRQDISHKTKVTIDHDLPRTFATIEWVTQHYGDIKALLVSYASVHKGDSYLQGFNYQAAVICYVFRETEHAAADAWWCFSRVVGLIRPLIPDFNVAWFHWSRRYWLDELLKRLRKSRPQLHSILEPQKERFSTLITCKWFMLWFTQTVPWDDLFELWDIFIDLPSQKLLKVYTLILHEVLKEAAPTITYRWSNEPLGTLHAILSLKIKNIQKMAKKVI